MGMLAALLAIGLQADPYLLEIGTPGKVTVDIGMTSMATRGQVGLNDIVKAAEGKRFVFVGESHDQLQHHRTQAGVINALVAAGRDVVVGFEMFTRDNQASLAPWTRGFWTDDEFIERSSWETQWGFDFKIYKPIFDATKEHGLPMIALNVPRDWIRQIGSEGPMSLTPEQKQWVPSLYLQDKTHREIFDVMMFGHPPGARLENTYAAMVAWDEGMADTALTYMDSRFNSNLVMVIVVGSGHMMYDRGINYRVARRTGESSLNVLCITSEGARQVSRGIADFVFVSRPEEGASG